MTPPTARVRHGAACSLPTYQIDPDTGLRVRGVLSPWVPIELRFSHLDDEGREVWLVPAAHFYPGAVIEVDPLPPNVRVEYEIERPQVIGRPLPSVHEHEDGYELADTADIGKEVLP